MTSLFRVLATADWQIVDTEQGKHVEIAQDSIAVISKTEYSALGRIVLDRPIVDPKTSASYGTIEVLNCFNGVERRYATLKRSYYKADRTIFRQEEVINPFALPVRFGTPDDRLLREVCRPKLPGATMAVAGGTVGKVSEAATKLRKLNDQMVEKEVQKDLKKLMRSASAESAEHVNARPASRRRKPLPSPAPLVPWAYVATGGPEYWGSLQAEYATCSAGHRQSPIELRDSISVNLETVKLSYRFDSFRVVDSKRSLHANVPLWRGFTLLGKRYELRRIDFHPPLNLRSMEHRSTWRRNWCITRRVAR